MSLRAYTDHVDDYNRTHTIEIHKSGYSGSVDYLKNTGSGYASFDYEKIDPKNPTDNPIQKGALEFSLWLQSSDLIDEIKTADEQTFWAVHKVDGTQEWIGYIYNDLSTYEEGFENHPFRITLMAKDFTDLGGKDYLVSGSLPDDREKVIETIAALLDTVGFDMPIKTHTSWIEENLSGDYDYLNEIYHETKALREFGRTGDEADQPITVEDALNKLCVNHGLLLKQADGCYWIDQLTEYEDPTSVQEAEYDLTGSQTAFSTTNDLTVDANTNDLKVTIQQDNRDNSGLPGLKRVKNKYDHRTVIIDNFVPSRVVILDGEPNQNFSEEFNLDGTQNVVLNFDVSAVDFSDSSDDGSLEIILTVGGQTWDSSSQSWVAAGTGSFDVPLTKVGSSFTGSVDFDEQVPVTGEDITVGLTLRKATIGGSEADNTAYSNINFALTNPDNEDGSSNSINYQLTQTGNYSVVSELDTTWFGDAPASYSVAGLRYSSSGGDLADSSWQRKGSTSYRNFHHNLLAEHLDVRRGWRRLLSATLKGLYYPWQILSYDSEYFYFLGGSWDLFTGNWEGELFSLDIETGSDTFDDIPKFSDDSGTGTGSTGGSSGGGGLDQSTADARYFKQNSLFSEIATGDQNEAIGNLGLTDGSADLDLNSIELSVADSSDQTPFTIDRSGHTSGDETSIAYTHDGFERGKIAFHAEGTDDTGIKFYGYESASLTEIMHVSKHGDVSSIRDIDMSRALTAASADFSGALEANTLRTDTGKFLAPTSYAFRNAGDTGFRDVEMAGLTATTGIFSDNIGFNSSNYDGAIRHRVGTTDNVVFGFKNDTSSTFFAGFDVDNDVFGFVEGVTPIADSGVRIFTNGNMFVDGGLFAKEFVVDQERTFFSFNLSPGGGKVSFVSGSTGSEVVTFEDTDGTAFTPVDTDDIIVIQERTGLNSGAIVKSIRRRVASLSGTDIMLTDSGISWDSGTDDVGAIEVGDNAVVKGNTTKAVRDGYIEYIVQADMPYQSVWDGVDDVGGGFEALRVGGMDGFDGSITGDVGIAGATQSDGAVFWITEDEAKIGAFTFDDISLSNDDIYIGDQVQSASERMRLGMWETGGGDRYPYFRIEDDQGNPRIAIVSREEVDGFAGFLALDASQNTLAKIGTENRIAGSYFDSTDMFGFSGTPPADPYANKDQASVRLDFANGAIFYDALGSIVYAQNTSAGYGTNDSVSETFIDDWEQTAQEIDPQQTNRSTDIKKRVRYRAKYGINELEVTGLLRRDTSGSALSTSGARIRIEISGQNAESSKVTSSSYEERTATIDNLSLTQGTVYDIDVILVAEVDSSNQTDGADPANVTAYLRDDIIITDGT